MLASSLRCRRARSIPFAAVLLVWCVTGCTQSSPADHVDPDACRTLTRQRAAWESSAQLEQAPRRICISDRLELLTPVRAELQTYGLPIAASNRHDCDIILDAEVFAKPTLGEMPVEVAQQWVASVDGYAWSTDVGDGSTRTLTLFANSVRGVHHGVHALAAAFAMQLRSSLASTNAGTERVALAGADWPRFPIRGVIEGYYNRYQTRSERANTMRLMHEVRHNTYLYAPKGDAFGTSRWRDAYDSDGAADIASAAADADRLGIDFIYGVSPMQGAADETGREPIRFSSPEDFAALIGKLRALQSLGVRRFALLFDDVRADFVWDADRERYSSLVDAHIDLSNRVAAAIGTPLWFVGTFYSDHFSGWESYVEALGARLDRSIDVMWTGPTVFSQTIRAADLAAVNATLGRQVLIWDNWPIEAHAVEGRSADLYTATPALMTNATLVGDYGHPLEDFWRVLGPLGSYAWDPTTYDAAAAYSLWQSILAGLASGC